MSATSITPRAVLRATCLGLLTALLLMELATVLLFIQAAQGEGGFADSVFAGSWWAWPLLSVGFLLFLAAKKPLLSLLALLLVAGVSTLIFERTRLRHHRRRYGRIVLGCLVLLYGGLWLLSLLL